MLKNKLFGNILLAPASEGGGSEKVNDEALDQQLENAADVSKAGADDSASAKTGSELITKDVKTTIPKELLGEEAIGDSLDETKEDGITRVDVKAKVEPAVKIAPSIELPPKLTLAEQKAADLKAGQRDYTIFKDDDAKILRAAGNNKVFDYFKERLPKLYQLEKELTDTKVKLTDAEKGVVKMPESYNEHPEAFKLTPEYRQTVSNLRQASLEEQHLMQQLVNIENNEKVTLVKGFNTNTGELVLSEPQDVTGEIKVAVNQGLQSIHGHKNKFMSDLGTLRDGHVKQYQDAVKMVSDECAKYFPWVTNEKMMKEVMLEVETTDESGKKKLVNATIENVLADAVAMHHPSFQRHPLVMANANLIVSNLMGAQKIRMLQNELGIKKQIVKDSDRAEPDTSTKASGAAKAAGGDSLKGGDAIGNLDEMKD